MYHIDFDSPVPLFEQIEQKTRLGIATGEFPEGTTIPTVLDVAKATTINHITVLKAYRRLTEEGLLSPMRGVGFTVVKGAKRRCEAYRQDFFARRLEETLDEGKHGGLSPDEMREIFEAALEKISATIPLRNNLQIGTEDGRNE